MRSVALLTTKLNGGGAERCVSNLSIELSEFYNVYILLFDGKNVVYPYKGTLIDLGNSESKTYLGKLLLFIKRTLKVWKIKKELSIDITVSFLEEPNLINVLTKTNDKAIVSVRNYMSYKYKSNISRHIVKYVSLKADLTISLSEKVRLDLNKTFNIPFSKVKTIYNHVDGKLLEEQESDKIIEFDKRYRYIINIGRLHQQKGQWHLVRAFYEVQKIVPNARLIIFGEGELIYSLKLLVKALGIDEKVTMPGFIKAPHRYIKKCDMFVLTSVYEGLGNVLLEASAMGIPVISTDCNAGPREILAPNSDFSVSSTQMELVEYGILVPVDYKKNIDSIEELSKEESELVKAMLLILRDKEKKEFYSKRSLENAARFEKKHIISEWMECIEDMMC